MYIDIFFFVNFLMNYLVLALLGIIRKRKIFSKKILIAAAIGAVFSIFVILTGIGKYTFVFIFMYVFISGALLRLAFGKVSAREGIGNIFLFYLLCFLVCGILVYTSEIFGGTSTSMAQILASSIILIILGKSGIPFLIGKYRMMKSKYSVEIEYKGKKIIGTGFLDTGNQLREPVSQQPVLVIEYNSVKKLLSEEEIAFINEYPMGTLSDGKVFIHYIPFHSIGKDNGYLLGFKADFLKINMNGEWKMVLKPWLGIHNSVVSSVGEYEMLLHEDFIIG